jgi:DHA2 family methylenomycin A resistance protein-like MFS transporter
MEDKSADGSGRPARSPLLVTAVCAIGLGCVMFDQTSLVVALATIGRDLNAGIAGLQWLSAIMPLMAATAIPVSGTLAARYGARVVLRTGLIVFACGAALASLSTALPALLAARAVQGLGMALILPSGPNLLGANIPAGPARQRTVGYWIAVSSAGLFLGPLVGGFVVAQFGWRVTFIALVPLTLIGAATTTLLHDTARAKPGPLDLAGLTLVCLSLGTLAWALIETGRGNAPTVFVVGGYVLAAGLFGLFLLVERRAVNPVLDLSVLGTRTLRVLLPAVLIYNAVVNGSSFVVSMYLQEGRQVSTELAGVFILIANIGMPLAGPLTTAMRRLARPGVIMLGSLAALVGSLVLLGFSEILMLPVLALPLFVFGLAAGVLYSIDTVTVLDTTEGAASATATATLALMRQVGTVIGIAALASTGQLAASLGVAPRGETVAFLVGGLVLLLLLLRLRPRIT